MLLVVAFLCHMTLHRRMALGALRDKRTWQVVLRTMFSKTLLVSGGVKNNRIFDSCQKRLLAYQTKYAFSENSQPVLVVCIARYTKDTPPQQAMRLYFHPTSTAKPGPPQTMLVTELQRDCRTRNKLPNTKNHLSSLWFQRQDRDAMRSFKKKTISPLWRIILNISHQLIQTFISH